MATGREALAVICRLAVTGRAPRRTTHSGQWKPTEAWCMQSTQISRSHRWQLTPPRRSGCR
ncbi:MAG: hypothetical protein F4110_07435 [Acidimicrobiaceae bacterium]|nr:hypothetical protein [Acidimicrobiaceae bacterium]MXZ97729.1 hypothetical protein [Acidimicrobiaceae bacterium]MYE96848.1 hypothetical protein [Acidimicrobiaceae bacterium]MYH42687.1 hypothetical protein [Acidimicrobiaceae bacterium]MYI53796.1 hypothetical protein [Acidimicrobiaceae bacterium]